MLKDRSQWSELTEHRQTIDIICAIFVTLYTSFIYFYIFKLIFDVSTLILSW